MNLFLIKFEDVENYERFNLSEALCVLFLQVDDKVFLQGPVMNNNILYDTKYQYLSKCIISSLKIEERQSVLKIAEGNSANFSILHVLHGSMIMHRQTGIVNVRLM